MMRRTHRRRPIVDARSVRPRYVERGGEMVYAQPYTAVGARMYSFTIDADESRLDAMVRSQLVDPSGGSLRMTTVGPMALLSFVAIQILRPADEPDAALGSLPEREAAIWVPVVDRRRNELLWYVAYMFVDSPLAMASGREVYGYPKQLGRITIPDTEPPPALLELAATSLKVFRPSEVARLHRLIRVERPVTATEVAPARASPRDLVRDLGAEPDETGKPPLTEGPLGHLGTALLLARQLLSGTIPLVLLKQFRDAERPWQACYSGIVKATNVLTGFRAAGVLPSDYSITISDVDSEPFRRDLGLPPGPLRPGYGVWVDFDFATQLGEVLWDSLGRRADG
jgi:Acetoacetate decarboxylase (ADC)